MWERLPQTKRQAAQQHDSQSVQRGSSGSHGGGTGVMHGRVSSAANRSEQPSHYSRPHPNSGLSTEVPSTTVPEPNKSFNRPANRSQHRERHRIAARAPASLRTLLPESRTMEPHCLRHCQLIRQQETSKHMRLPTYVQRIAFNRSAEGSHSPIAG